MVHLFCTDTLALFKPIDGGNIGQAIRFVQGFDMFTSRIVSSSHSTAVAEIAKEVSGDRIDMQRYDLLLFDRSGVWGPPSPGDDVSPGTPPAIPEAGDSFSLA
jgi:hypothetical protein